MGVFVVFCVLKLVISLLSLSGLELTAILLPQLPEGWQVCAVYAPSSPTMARFLPVIGPLGREPGCPWWDTEPVHFPWAVGGAGPKELPVPSSLSRQFVVCEPVEIAGSINERKTRGFVGFLTQKYWGTLGSKILQVFRGTGFAFPRLSDFTLLCPVGKPRQARCDPNTRSPPSLLWILKVSVAHASVHRPD